MFQTSLLNTNDLKGSTEIESPSINWSRYFATPSLLVDDKFVSEVGKGKNAVNRTTTVNDDVSVYRNLNKPKYFSIKQNSGELKGKVSGYAQAVIVENPRFIVSLALQKRVNREKKRCVHAYIRGNCIAAFDSTLLQVPSNAVRTSYSPYVGSYLYTLERGENEELFPDSISRFNDIASYRYALITGADIFLFNI